ncbi:MAG TPA: ThuA domain-containing protein [Gemmatirosa sp.]
MPPAGAVVLTGGPTHDFPATTACLVALLGEQGLAADVHEDVDEGLRALPGARLLVVNALRWTMRGPATPERYRTRAAAEGVSPAPDARAALAAHLRGGGGVLGMHTASICFDDWPEWGTTLGGAWRWGRSFHPPLGDLAVEVAAPAHPLVAGLADFGVVDERYSNLDHGSDLDHGADPVEPLLVADGHPLLWARRYGGGRVVYDALGHDLPSYAVPEHREIVRRAIRWTAGLGEEEAA